MVCGKLCNQHDRLQDTNYRLTRVISLESFTYLYTVCGLIVALDFIAKMPFSARSFIRQHLAVIGRATGRLIRRIGRNLLDVDCLRPGSEHDSQSRNSQGQTGAGVTDSNAEARSETEKRGQTVQPRRPRLQPQPARAPYTKSAQLVKTKTGKLVCQVSKLNLGVSSPDFLNKNVFANLLTIKLTIVLSY